MDKQKSQVYVVTMVIAVLSSGDSVAKDLLLSLLPKCKLIIAADRGLLLLQGTGFTADLLVGDLDSLTDTNWQPLTREVLTLQSDKDVSDTDEAVAQAQVRNPSEIWLIGGSGGRMDHWLSNLRLVEKTPLVRRWFTAEERIIRLRAGDYLRLEPGRASLFPIGRAPWRVRSLGLVWPLDSVNFESWHSLSNQACETGGELWVDSGEFFSFQASNARELQA